MTSSGSPDYTAFAARYDSWFAASGTTAATVSALAGLAEGAGPGPALELGIGTGRIAVPLAARGVEVHGIDASPAMVEQLRAKPGGEHIPVTMGDFSAGAGADAGIPGAYALVYVVSGTFAELPSQDAQVDCFAGAARRLRPGGLFVLDAHVPEALVADRSTGGQVLPTAGGELVLRFRETDRAAQRYSSHYVVFDKGPGGLGMHRTTVSFRYAAPGELDLMARLAGLRLRERWGNWTGAPFTSSSAYHVSVYERPE
ncbi:methyltransferase domain-containing protein [Streptomyces rectiverticillatus]|uniref:class I SAM-dependent DNA methyltransferase n=1 Tax=Streptomyces rectiverticillatus TaxID=173860 RepID=UPI0015C30902|nr:class I SAM-dependent methyltransferase [Streptomyces rectiverticillatus]QLE71053.1 methyltransferase domain-containing protein [Streptomyces rectiverticillatus]